MRDLFLLVFFPFFLYYGFRTPFVALSLWLWTSMYPMQNWLYGFGLSLRFNMTFSIVTILGYFAMKNKPTFRMTGLFILVLLFFLHSTLGVTFNGYSSQWNKFEIFAKTIIFFVMATLILRKKHHFETILVFVCLSLCVFGVMEGLKVLASGGGHKVAGIKGPLGDNNKVALGLNMCIPLVLYLVNQFDHKRIKQGLKVVVFLCVLAILGTASRGGLVALSVMGVYYWWKNGRNLSIIFAIVFIVGLASQLMPDRWFDRMDTLKDTEGSGALTLRVQFWKVNYLAALDNPVVGLGFDGTAYKANWFQYRNEIERMDWGIYTPVPSKGYVAHSIYFEVLGNQGILGLLLFLLILFVCFKSITRLVKHYGKSSWQGQLLNTLNVSLVTYCIGGAALNAAYFELLYLIFAMVICLHISSLTEKREQPAVMSAQ